MLLFLYGLGRLGETHSSDAREYKQINKQMEVLG